MYWFNSLEVSPSKLQSIPLKNKNVNAEDFNDHDAINLTDSMLVLGDDRDDKLNFNNHVPNMCNKAGAQLKYFATTSGFFRLRKSVIYTYEFYHAIF